MTVSTDDNQELNIGQIVTHAYRKAGLLNVYQRLDTTRRAAAMETLGLIVDALQNKGVMSRARTIVVASVAAGAAEVTLPANVIEVLGPCQLVDSDDDPSLPTTETPITLISQGTWSSIASKAALGVPSMAYPDQSGDAIVLRFIPGSQDACYIRCPVQVLLPSVKDAEATMPFKRSWAMYFVYALAAELAMDAGLQAKVPTLKASAQQELILNIGHSVARAAIQISVSAPTGWRRR